MWYIAFTLGLFGSLHCVGMCGPLAIAFCDKEGQNTVARVFTNLAYNLGRTATYALMGLVLGLLGSFLFLADLQKTLSITLGVLLVLSFLFSIDIDHKINTIPIVQKSYQKVRTLINKLYQRTKQYPTFILGMANGLLPCGLVYLALTGALATGDVLDGMLFMILFGLGTLPMLFGLVFGIRFVTPSARLKFRKVLPYATLGLGIFLIYRGIVVDLPVEFNFWEAIKNPIMCH